MTFFCFVDCVLVSSWSCLTIVGTGNEMVIYHDQWYYEAEFNEESSQDTRMYVKQERVDLLLNGRGTCKVGLWWLYGTVSDIFSYIEPDYVPLSLWWHNITTLLLLSRNKSVAYGLSQCTMEQKLC